MICAQTHAARDPISWPAGRAAARATQQAGVKLAGENALPVDNWEAYDMILAKSKYLGSFCFLRFTEALTDPNNEFRKFVHYLSKVQRPLPQSA